MTNIKALRSENTITLHYKGEVLNVQKDNPSYEKVNELIDQGKIDELITEFLQIKERIEKYTNKNFTVQGNRLRLKGESEAMPEMIAQRLIELEKAGEDFMPLIRFWKKLKKNPSEQSKHELYGFIKASKIPITETGDILVEKGVSRKRGGSIHDLVDCHTNTIDNSVGMIVSMERSKVDNNRNRTCSYGLHVGAPDYVRNHWNSEVIVECLVNPADVVSVPVDYNDTKMRVCRYQVIRYSDKSRNAPSRLNVSLDEITSIEAINKSLERVSKKSAGTIEGTTVISESSDLKTLLSDMTAKRIIQFVKEELGVVINMNPKNKKSIVKKAIELFEESKSAKKVKLSKKSTAKEIVDMTKKDLGIDIGPKSGSPRKERVLKRAKKAYQEAGYKVFVVSK